jgi:hypothetical protein
MVGTAPLVKFLQCIKAHVGFVGTRAKRLEGSLVRGLVGLLTKYAQLAPQMAVGIEEAHFLWEDYAFVPV